MPDIQVLSPHLADLIAAGEVVERPASVVKELVENAIDAGATSVTVEITGGGMRSIRVTDNGCGIPAEDAPTAFLRHATSKLRTEYDLEAIGTLGFRGEALAAISAVSRVELLTRTPGADYGASLLLEGGEICSNEEAGCPEGTTLIVRDLFYNTPARLKFMKRDSAEGAAVASVLQHEALAHPELSFRFLREGKEELLTPGDGRLSSTLYAVLGREAALGFLDCPATGEELRVAGYVSRPACCRGTRAMQFFFVNGRYVKSRTMTAALEQAYANTKMVGRFPGCVLSVTCKLNRVDVNVHPAKTEVKFADERGLFDAVYNAVRSALEREQGHVQAVLEEKRPRPQRSDTVTPNQTFFQSMTAQTFRQQQAQTGPRTASPARHGDSRPPQRRDQSRELNVVMEALNLKRPSPLPRQAQPDPLPWAETDPGQESDTLAPLPLRSVLLKRPPDPQATEPDPMETDTAPAAPAAPWTAQDADMEVDPGSNVDPYSQVETSPAGPWERQPWPDEEPAAIGSGVAAAAPAAAVTLAWQSEDEETGEASEPVAEQRLTTQAESGTSPESPTWRIAGEVLHTYIIVEQGDTITLIDKHAAHERMNFDRMRAQDYAPMSQLLLSPVVVSLPPAESEALLDNLPLLARFGFQAEDFGGGDLLVREAPDYLSPGSVETTLSEIAGELLATGAADPEAARDRVLHTMACKAAIKGGWETSTAELEVVAAAVMSGQVRYCPHGRPVAIELTRKGLEKQFGRIQPSGQ